MYKKNFEKNKFKFIGSALLLYIIIITLLFTLAPFNYEIPDKLSDDFWSFNIKDVIKNILLFIPFGFVVYQLQRGKNRLRCSILLGFSFSVFIEINQLFLDERSTGINDILFNTFGTVVGVYAHNYIKDFVRQRSSSILNLSIPVINIIFLLIPLLWISSIASGKETSRLLLLCLLAFMGVLLITEIYINRMPVRTKYNLLLFLFMINGWYLISVFPGLLKAPLYILLFLFFLNIVAFARMKMGKKKKIDMDFEKNVLSKIIPFFIVYLILLSLWPINFFGKFSGFAISADLVLDNENFLLSIFRYLEYFTAFTIAGYFVAQYVNRLKNQTSKILKALILLAFASFIFEIPRAFHLHYKASLEHLSIAFAWSVFGAGIYLMQLDYFKFVKEERV